MSVQEKSKGVVKSYRDLIVWQQAMELVTAVYRFTGEFPKTEIFALTSQIRRSAISIPSNIAEGYGRHSTSDYVRFLQIATGSLYEFQTQLEISRNLGLIKPEVFEITEAKSHEIERMLVSLTNKLREKIELP